MWEHGEPIGPFLACETGSGFLFRSVAIGWCMHNGAGWKKQGYARDAEGHCWGGGCHCPRPPDHITICPHTHTPLPAKTRVRPSGAHLWYVPRRSLLGGVLGLGPVLRLAPVRGAA